MTIDLTVSGDPGSIRAVAVWLDPDLRGGAVAADLELAYVWNDSQTYWTGEAGTAFRETAKKVRDVTGVAHGYLSDAAEVFRAYAGRLDRGQDELDGLGRQAAAWGLTVADRVVARPTTSLGYCPAPGSGDDRAEYEKHLRLVAVYEELATRVGEWWGETEAWIAEHIVPLTVRIESLGPLATLLDRLTVGNEDVVQTALEYAKHRTDRDLSRYRTKAGLLQAEADRYAKGLRSGNPSLRAAAEAANPKAVRQGLADLAHTIGKVTTYAKLIPVAGAVVEIVSSGAEIADGRSVSSVGMGLLGGAAGGAGAGVLIAATFTVPPAALAAAVVGAAFVASNVASWAREEWVPLDVREAIDSFLLAPAPLSPR